MNILSWFKGKNKQKEISKYKKDNNFSFNKNYYGDINILDGFKILYCNNYNKICNNNILNISFISCTISLPNNIKILTDIIEFTNIIINKNSLFLNKINYNNININIDEENNKILIFLRGNILFYKTICDNIYNNIITKYIRNNIFPDDININCPIEFESNLFNSINCPSKPIDILFIENNILCKQFKPVIGLSISNNEYISKSCPINYSNKNIILENNRTILYISIDRLNNEELEYIINNVQYGNNLLTFIHQSIDTDININLDIDEII